MTPTRLREILARFGWSPRALAGFLGIHETGPRKWANGKTEIPATVGDWLEAIDAGPVGWRKKDSETDDAADEP
jgi:hypothetical protein